MLLQLHMKKTTPINITFIYQLSCTCPGVLAVQKFKKILKISQDRKQAPIPIWNLRSGAF